MNRQYTDRKVVKSEPPYDLKSVSVVRSFELLGQNTSASR